VVEIDESGFLTNFLFQFVDRAGGLDGLDASAFGADEVIAMHSRNEKGEVGRAFMEAETSNHPFVAETLQEAENGGFVADRREVLILCKLRKRHGPVVLVKATKQGLEGLGPPEPGLAGPLKK